MATEGQVQHMQVYIENTKSGQLITIWSTTE